MNILFRYFPAILPGIVILLGQLQLFLTDERIDSEEGGALIAAVAGVVVTFVVPIVKGPWAGALKTGAAVLAAVATLIIPLFLPGGFTWTTLVAFALAVLTAVATEIGVQVRTDSRKPRHAEQNADGVYDVTSLSDGSIPVSLTIADVQKISTMADSLGTARQPYPTE